MGKYFRSEMEKQAFIGAALKTVGKWLIKTKPGRIVGGLGLSIGGPMAANKAYDLAHGPMGGRILGESLGVSGNLMYVRPKLPVKTYEPTNIASESIMGRAAETALGNRGL